MKQLNQMCLPFILLLIIIIVFIVLLIINHSELLDNDRNYSFQEAIQKQTDSSVLNTVDRDGEFVNANSREIERAMRITRDDNKFKYMDISQQVPMSKQEVKKMLRGNGILENQADAFIEAQDKYQVNIIYLISHARVETANGNSKLASGIKEGNNRYYNFLVSVLSMKMLFIQVRVTLRRHHGLHHAKRYLVELNLLERIILIMIKLRCIK